MNTVGTRNHETRLTWVQRELAEIPKGARILDAGAGERSYEQYCGHLMYVAQDFAQYDGVGDSTGLQQGVWDQERLDIISDITAIPEPDESFDAIMCIEVFEHLPDPVAAVKEFWRLLKPDGVLLLTAPFCSMTHFAPYHFSSGFNRYFYQHHLLNQGFTIEEIQSNGNFFEFLAQEIRRIPLVSDKYSVNKTSCLERWACDRMLRMLERLSNKDRGSSEFVCFGYHVKARKNARA